MEQGSQNRRFLKITFNPQHNILARVRLPAVLEREFVRFATDPLVHHGHGQHPQRINSESWFLRDSFLSSCPILLLSQHRLYFKLPISLFALIIRTTSLPSCDPSLLVFWFSTRVFKTPKGFSNLVWQFNFLLFKEKEHPEKRHRGLHSFPHLREEKEILRTETGVGVGEWCGGEESHLITAGVLSGKLVFSIHTFKNYFKPRLPSPNSCPWKFTPMHLSEIMELGWNCLHSQFSNTLLLNHLYEWHCW